MTSSKLVEISVEIRHETDKAYLLFDGTKEAWFPKSQIEVQPCDHSFGIVAVMSEWLAKKAEFI